MDNLPSGAAEVPSPELVAAWEQLGLVPAEKVPLCAAYWIAAGFDGESLVQLAGLHGDDPHDVHDLDPAALEDCGIHMEDGVSHPEARDLRERPGRGAREPDNR